VSRSPSHSLLDGTPPISYHCIEYPGFFKMRASPLRINASINTKALIGGHVWGLFGIILKLGGSFGALAPSQSR
jgi:hypothetical protein